MSDILREGDYQMAEHLSCVVLKEANERDRTSILTTLAEEAMRLANYERSIFQSGRQAENMFRDKMMEYMSLEDVSVEGRESMRQAVMDGLVRGGGLGNGVIRTPRKLDRAARKRLDRLQEFVSNSFDQQGQVTQSNTQRAVLT